MKIALFGGTGHIGSLVLQQALAQGHKVTALVRSRAKIDAHTATTAHIVVGSIENQTAVRYALEGAEAVIVTLAAGHEVLANFDKSALPILNIHGPRRIVSMVGAAVRMSGDPKTIGLSLMSAAMRLVPGGLLRDAEGHADRLASFDLDWTLVRAANFSDVPPTGNIKVHLTDEMPVDASISRADLAAFILETAVSGSFVRQAPMVCNG
jgi:putative NADH-flavin reductase